MVDVATFTVYSAIGNREDLSNMIYRIDPTETPFLSGVDKETANAVNHEWQTQALAAATSTNSVLEGDDLTTDTTTATIRLGNLVQISKKVARVSGTQQAVEHAGRANELDYQVMLKGLELKRDMETLLLNNQAKSTGAFSGSPRALGSILAWIYTNQSLNTSSVGATAPNGASARIDTTGLRAFTEGQLKTVLQSIWSNGGKPDQIQVGGFNKQQFSMFTGRAQPVEPTDQRRIVAAVDAYDSDFGRLKVVPNRFMRTRDVLILQTDMWAVAYTPGRNFAAFPLSKTGDSDRKAVISEYTLVSRNEKASGGVFDVTSA